MRLVADSRGLQRFESRSREGRCPLMSGYPCAVVYRERLVEVRTPIASGWLLLWGWDRCLRPPEPSRSAFHFSSFGHSDLASPFSAELITEKSSVCHCPCAWCWGRSEGSTVAVLWTMWQMITVVFKGAWLVMEITDGLQFLCVIRNPFGPYRRRTLLDSLGDWRG